MERTSRAARCWLYCVFFLSASLAVCPESSLAADLVDARGALSSAEAPRSRAPEAAEQGPLDVYMGNATELRVGDEEGLGAVPFGPCSFSCAGVPEGEACGVVSNNGCNLVPFDQGNFRDVVCGEIVCGTLWADAGNRDTDFLRLELSAVTTLSVAVRSNLPLIVALIADPDADCTSLNLFRATVQPGNCGLVGITHTVPAGTYYVFLGPDAGDGAGLFTGFPCGTSNDYEVELSCVEPPCTLPPGGTPEGEAFPANDNGGCTLVPPVYDFLATGQSIRGTSWAQAGSRDTDWFQFTVSTDPATATLELLSEFPAELILAELGCAPFNIVGSGFSTACASGSGGTANVIDVTLSPGDYVAVVIPADEELGDIFDGIAPGDPAANYLLSLDLTPLGPSCTLTCAGGAEAETCGQTTNNGCNLPVPAFESIGAGETRCASSWASQGTRDTDWWEITLDVPTTVSWTISGQLPLNSLLLRETGASGDCGTLTVVSPLTSSAGDCGLVGSPSIDLPCGTYYLFVGPGNAQGDAIFTGFPCSLGSNDYSLTLQTASATTCFDLDVSVQSVCGSGIIEFDVEPGQCSLGLLAEVRDPGGVVVETQSLGILQACTLASFSAGPFSSSGAYTVTLTGDCCAGGSLMVEQVVDVVVSVGPVGFLRGNCNNDAAIDLGDAVTLLSALFPAGPVPPPPLACSDACDTNDDGFLDLADAVQLLSALFGSPPAVLPAPNCVCGPDPTADSLDCAGYNVASCP